MPGRELILRTRASGKWRRLVEAQEGDTVGMAASRYGMSSRELLVANGVSPSTDAADAWVLYGMRDPWVRGVVTGGAGRREKFNAALSPDPIRRLGRALMSQRTMFFVLER